MSLTLPAINTAIKEFVLGTTIPSKTLVEIISILSEATVTGFFTKKTIETLRQKISESNNPYMETYLIDFITEFQYYLFLNGIVVDEIFAMVSNILTNLVPSQQNEAISLFNTQVLQQFAPVTDAHNVTILFLVRINTIEFLRVLSLKTANE